VREWQGKVIFLHEVAAGTADRSYGIHVARLAGLPASVVRRAEQVLKRLESGDQANTIERLAEELPLFAPLRAAAPAAPAPAPPNPALEALQAIDPDTLTPRQALEALYRLRGLADGDTAT
jgi:DNA mismatch repair protein MutS